MSERAETLALAVGDYLMNQQVVSDDVTTPEGTFTTLELGGDTEPVSYRVWIDDAGDPPTVSFGRADDAAPSAGPFPIGSYLRLFRGRHIHEAVDTYTVEGETGYAGRLAMKYLRLTARELARPTPTRIARVAEGLSNLGRYFLDRTGRVASSARFESVIGITWHVTAIGDGRVSLTCYDRGGILDHHTNSEVHELPPQVMGTVYADAYAAWSFLRIARHRGDERSRRAADLACEFLARVYPGYAVSLTPMTHADFKNAGLLESLADFPDDIPADTRATLEAQARTLRADLYLPTNVQALRVHWLTAQRAHTEVAERTVRGSIAKVQRDLLPGGLIQDNNPGRFYFDSHDLTYHQYTLACLADALRSHARDDVRDLFMAGARFSLRALTPDGEVSYMGRGANNVYHLTSAYTAFRLAATLTDDIDERGQFRSGADRMLSYVETAKRADGMLATAVNENIAERMAWNHCHTPYNALSCYHLWRGRDEADGPDDVAFPAERVGRFDVMPECRFAFVTTSGYYAAVFAGGERSYAWSADNHFVGAPGLAILGVSGMGAVLPALDGDVTDAAFSGADPTGRGTLARIAGAVPGVTVSQQSTRHYVFLPDRVVAVTVGRLRDGLRVPVRADGSWRTVRGRDGAITSRSESGGVEWRLHHASSPVGEWAATRTSNPRGWVDLLRAPIDVDGATTVVQSIMPFAGEPPAPRPLDVRVEGKRTVVTTDDATIVLVGASIEVAPQPT